MNFTISVIIPTYNRYTMLKRAIKSVYAQSFQPFEVIVVDDGSTDDTKKIQKEFPDIIYIYQTNKGVSSARNKGIKEAQGEWIAFLDDDDEWEKEKLSFQMEFHRCNPEVLVSYTDEKWIKNSNEILIPKKYHKPKQNGFCDHVSYCNIAPSSVICHKTVFEKVGFFDEDLSVCEDYDLWLRILREFSFGYVDKKLIKKYAGHKDQLGFSEALDRYRVKALQKHIDCKYNVEVAKELLKKYDILIRGAKKQGKNFFPYQKKKEELLKKFFS
ncbi:MAG: glycosyltransferase family 2 protein [Epsilonproteobacteria bacterium]|nr:glycosyltransferase family 2 protein [Campylobacterota bacterium]